MVVALGRPARPEYYLDSQQTLHGPLHGAEGRQEARGAWWNPNGLFGLADGGPVEAETYRNLYRGFSPDGLTGLLPKRGGRRRGGTDLVFPADKSISALWALADPARGRQIEQAHDDAVRVALLEIVSKHASWISRYRFGAREVLAARAMGAMFRHGASRAGDPHLHTHCVIFNLGFPDDGTCRSLDQYAFRCWMRAAGPVYRHALAWNLRERLGIQCEQYGRNGALTRVAGMPFGLVHEWSKRHRTMEAAMEGVGTRTGSASSLQVDMFSRATRDRPVDRHPELESLIPVWTRERDDHVADPARLIESLPGPESRIRLREIMRRLERLPEELAAGRFVFSYPSVIEGVCNVTAGHMDWRSADSWVTDIVYRPGIERVDDPERSPAARAGRLDLRLYALTETDGLRDELRQAARELAVDGRFGVPRPAVEERIGALAAAGYPLADADIAAIRHCTSSSRIAVIEFAPAMDRSLVLRPVADLYRERGYQVIGTASTLRSAAELHNESGIDAMQVERFLRVSRNGGLDEDRSLVLAVADAGILSARDLVTLVEFSERYLAKILLVATSGQRPTLATTPALDLVIAGAGRLRVGTPVSPLSEAGWTRREAVGGADAGEEVPEALPRVTVSQAISGVDHQAQELSGRVRFCAGLHDAFERMAEEWEQVTQAGGSIAVVVRTRKEEKALNHVVRARLFAGSADGPRVRLRVHCRSGRREYGVAAPIEIRTGDWLRLGVTLWEKRLFRGSVVAVEDIVSVAPASAPPRYLFRVRTETGRREEFFHDEVRDAHGGIRLAHGYVSMVADMIGRFDRVLVLADDRWEMEQLERAASCCRGEIDLHVDRRLLAAAMCPADAWNGPWSGVDDSQILDHLRHCWSLPYGSTHPRRTPRPEIVRLYPDGDTSVGTWISANDDGGGSLRRLAGYITCSELDARHGETVAAFASGRSEVLAEWARCQERISADGDSALLSPSAGNTIRRHRKLLDLAGALPRPRDAGVTRFLAECGGLTPGDIREFRDLYRRMRTDRWIAARRSGRRKSAGGEADARTDASRKARDIARDAKLVETYLAEVGQCREFRRFALDVAARQDWPVEELASWAESLADYERMIARGREMLAGELAADGSPRADDIDMATVRTAVETLEEERRQDLSGPDRRSDDEAVHERKRPLRAAVDEAHQTQKNSAGQGQSFSW